MASYPSPPSPSPSSRASSRRSHHAATAVAGLLCLVGLCLASPPSQQQFLPHPAAAAGPDAAQYGGAEYLAAAQTLLDSLAPTSSPSVNLYRLCVPSASSSHWTTSILPSLDSLAEHQAEWPLDIWRYPRGMATTQGGESEECIDFTYPSNDLAQRALEDFIHALPRQAEVDWVILADDEELKRRVEDQKRRTAATSVAGEVEEEAASSEEEDAGVAGRRKRKGKKAKERKTKGRMAKGGRRERQTKVVDDHFHNGYHPLHNITSFLSYQVAQRPDLIELVDLGATYENRIIQGVRLGQMHDNHGQPKKQIVISAGSHGREWITTSTSLYLISALLEPSSTHFLETFSVLLIPILNPDGYVYTWTSDRFFRKNRQLVSERRDWLGRKCYGLDISRSFPANFRASQPGTCGPTYSGSAPLQSAESQALASYLRNETNEVIAYVDLHSYGQLLLYPWMSCGPSRRGQEMPDEEDLAELALGAAREGRIAHNKVYRAGRGCQTMYNQDGSSVDFAHEAAHIKWSFEVELRDEGSFGFTLPPEMIRPTGEENWRMLQYLMRFVKEKEKL